MLRISFGPWSVLLSRYMDRFRGGGGGSGSNSCSRFPARSSWRSRVGPARRARYTQESPAAATVELGGGTWLATDAVTDGVPVPSGTNPTPSGTHWPPPPPPPDIATPPLPPATWPTWPPWPTPSSYCRFFFFSKLTCA